MANTAALCSQLDLIISVDTSAAHLAGALGYPTPLMLPWIPDWRWQLHRADSPWYPCLRLCRQQSRADWTAPFTEAQAAIFELKALYEADHNPSRREQSQGFVGHCAMSAEPDCRAKKTVGKP